MDKYHFTPKKLVHAIVSIYVNLGQRSEFCQALPQDGRSFSLSLLEEAAAIMRSVWGEMWENLSRLDTLEITVMFRDDRLIWEHANAVNLVALCYTKSVLLTVSWPS